MAARFENRKDNRREREVISLVSDMFRRAGWRVHREPVRARRPDLIVEGEGRRYVIEIKRAPESRRDRLIPLMSQAILEAQAAAQVAQSSELPVAIVFVPYVSESMAEEAFSFAFDHAPQVGVGLVDGQGFRRFRGLGLEQFNAERRAPELPKVPQGSPASNLFSDLNQWLLKILLGRSIPEELLSVPRGNYESGRQLAEAAGVSPMSGSRFLRQMASEGFLDEQPAVLHPVRVYELLERWKAASHRSFEEIPARWILPAGQGQLQAAVRSYRDREKRPRRRKGYPSDVLPRLCISLFAAANLLGYGFVHGAPSHLYLEELSAVALDRLGLSLLGRGAEGDVQIRVPENPEAVFRSAVERDGARVSDILQVWLDVSNHPARGKAQAEEIWNRVLAPRLGERP